MKDEREDPISGETTTPEAKRTGRDGGDGSKPAEYADEMHTNRFRDTPAPNESENDKR